MNKQTAIDMLGGTPKKAAEAMGYKAVQTVYQWPDELPRATADRVMGAAARLSAAGSPQISSSAPSGHRAQEAAHG